IYRRKRHSHQRHHFPGTPERSVVRASHHHFGQYRQNQTVSLHGEHMEPIRQGITGINPRVRHRIQAGFTLLETMIATFVLVIGVLGLAATLAQGLAWMNVSQYEYIAQQKASEAIESIFTARDQGQATWSTICNVGSTVCSNGMFLVGPQLLCDPGTDGILGTSDDYVSGACPTAATTDSVLLPNSS